VARYVALPQKEAFTQIWQELKSRIGSDLNIAISSTVFMQGVTFEQFIVYIGEQL
jgi:hypothetical protein